MTIIIDNDNDSDISTKKTFKYLKILKHDDHIYCHR